MAARLYIAAGSRRGRRIYAPKGRDVRPSPSRVRMAIFNMLRHEVKGARLLDLFAGSGSVGLEGLSRGGAFCLFVEKASASMQSIERNIEVLGLEGQTAVYKSDVFRCAVGVSRMYEPFDIVILDPPHDFWRSRKRELVKLIEKLRSTGAARPDAVWVIGHPRDAPRQEDLAFMGRLDHRGYGEAHVTIVNRWKPEGEESGDDGGDDDGEAGGDGEPGSGAEPAADPPPDPTPDPKPPDDPPQAT